MAHGMHNPDPDGIDDEDYISCFIAGVDHYLGMKPEEMTNNYMEGRIDLVQYELRHFVRLASVCNPNVMTLLEIEPLHKTWQGECLRSIKKSFYSKKAYNAFQGYAHQQIERMSRDVFEGYQGAKRKERFEEFGFDCKNAAHGIRLLRMGCEFFETGLWRIDRRECGDSIELLGIKNGEMAKSDVLIKFQELLERFKAAKERSSLSDEPDREKINDTVKAILKGSL